MDAGVYRNFGVTKPYILVVVYNVIYYLYNRVYVVHLSNKDYYYYDFFDVLSFVLIFFFLRVLYLQFKMFAPDLVKVARAFMYVRRDTSLHCRYTHTHIALETAFIFKLFFKTFTKLCLFCAVFALLYDGGLFFFL